MANKISNSLIALSSAAILAVYSAGYIRTSAAAHRFEESSHRRAYVPPSTRNASTAGEAVPANVAARLDRSAVAPVPTRAIPGAAVQPISTTAGLPTMENVPSSASTPAPMPSEVAAPAYTAPAAPSEPVAAAPVIDQPAAAPAVPGAAYRDGTYLGWGYSRHGDIQAFVVIQNGRIQAAGIEKCWTRYSCGWIDHLPPQVILRQSADVDFVSGATESVNALYGAVTEALAKAK